MRLFCGNNLYWVKGSETVLWHCSPISQLTITILGKGEIFVIWDYFRALEFHVPIEKTLEKGISEDWGLFYATEIACPIWQYFGESDISVFETILCHWNCMDLRVGCWNPMCKMTVRWSREFWSEMTLLFFQASPWAAGKYEGRWGLPQKCMNDHRQCFQWKRSTQPVLCREPCDFFLLILPACWFWLVVPM